MITSSSLSTKYSNYLAQNIEYLLSIQSCLLVTITGLFCYTYANKCEKIQKTNFLRRKILPVIFSTVTPSFACITFSCWNSISDHEISFSLVVTCWQSRALLFTTRSKDIRWVLLKNHSQHKTFANLPTFCSFIQVQIEWPFVIFRCASISGIYVEDSANQ